MPEGTADAAAVNGGCRTAAVAAVGMAMVILPSHKTR